MCFIVLYTTFNTYLRHSSIVCLEYCYNEVSTLIVYTLLHPFYTTSNILCVVFYYVYLLLFLIYISSQTSILSVVIGYIVYQIYPQPLLYTRLIVLRGIILFFYTNLLNYPLEYPQVYKSLTYMCFYIGIYVLQSSRQAVECFTLSNPLYLVQMFLRQVSKLYRPFKVHRLYIHLYDTVEASSQYFVLSRYTIYTSM